MAKEGYREGYTAKVMVKVNIICRISFRFFSEVGAGLVLEIDVTWLPFRYFKELFHSERELREGHFCLVPSQLGGKSRDVIGPHTVVVPNY